MTCTQTLTIPQRVGGTEEKGTIETIAELPPPPGSEVRVEVKRWIVLGRDQRGQEIAESCA